jgi:uncharacterized membrane protein YhaH (DUF805 family)
LNISAVAWAKGECRGASRKYRSGKFGAKRSRAVPLAELAYQFSATWSTVVGQSNNEGKMGFFEAIRSCFGKYVTFRGRARRSEYWYFTLFIVLITIPAAIIDEAVFPGAGGSATRNGPIEGALSLATFLPSLSVTVRRIHDTNWSGWLYGGFFLYLLAGLAFVAVFVSQMNSGATTPASIGAIVFGAGAVAYAIFLFVQMVRNGTAGPNKYGPDPKGHDVTEVFS